MSVPSGTLSRSLSAVELRLWKNVQVRKRDDYDFSLSCDGGMAKIPIRNAIIDGTRTKKNFKIFAFPEREINDAPLQTDATKQKKTKINTAYDLLLQERNILKSRVVELEEHKDRIYTLERELIERYKAENAALKDKIQFLTDKKQNLEELIVEKDSIINSNTELISINKIEYESLRRSLEEMLGETQSLRQRLLDADLKGNIRVVCRVRPHTQTEDSKSKCVIQYPDETSLVLSLASIEKSKNKRNAPQSFTFDKVFKEDSSQADIFEELALLVQSALDGYNICIFAYGQTGSGKTYTMEGGNTDDSFGMIPRTMDFVFSSIDARKILGWEFSVTASFLQIYNEHIYDLLDNSKNQKAHDIQMADPTGTDVRVSNLSVMEIKTSSDFKRLMRLAQENRAVAVTEMNERASRSHSVSKITLTGFNKNNQKQCVSSINLVDLAGSEKARNLEKTHLTETKTINQSLTSLTTVIIALLENRDYVPYRNSKITHLLKPSLGGNSKTLMLVNISPFEECYYESLNSLRFAAQVHLCKTAAKKN